MVKAKPRKRRFNVPRGTGVRAAAALGLAPSHCTRVINGKREGGQGLIEWLEKEEAAYFAENSKKYKESMKGFRAKVGLE
jgi:hypothetical protein